MYPETAQNFIGKRTPTNKIHNEWTSSTALCQLLGNLSADETLYVYKPGWKHYLWMGKEGTYGPGTIDEL